MHTYKTSYLVALLLLGPSILLASPVPKTDTLILPDLSARQVAVADSVAEEGPPPKPPPGPPSPPSGPPPGAVANTDDIERERQQGQRAGAAMAHNDGEP